MSFQVLDLQFQDVPQSIASYLVPHESGALLVECGPMSTVDVLRKQLAEHGVDAGDVTDVLVTHIHLDHAGSAGWWAEQGARVHAHHVGIPHLRDPSKLWTSATRIYGEENMDTLWGSVQSIPDEHLVSLEDGDRIEIGGVSIDVIETPGHAFHHVAYQMEEVCFTGDVAGVRVPGAPYVEPPLPPPEIHLDAWRESIERLRKRSIGRLALTHFGVFDDVDAHLTQLLEQLDAAEAFAHEIIPYDPPDDVLTAEVTDWLQDAAEARGVTGATWTRYETANPSWMAAAGLRRWYRKYATTERTT